MRGSRHGYDQGVGSLVSEVLPLALAVALSPFPVIPAILLLFTPRALANGFSFLAGWLFGIAIASVAFTLLASVIELFDEPPTWVSWTRIILGLLLLALGVRKWQRRDPDGSTPAWMASIDGLSPLGSLRLSLLLSVANPKVLLLAAAAGLAIGSAQVGVGSQVATIVFFTVIAASTVALPVLLFAAIGSKMLSPLGVVRAWLERHNAAVLVVVILAIGGALIVKGVSGL